MREWKRVLFAAISAAGLFLLLFLALRWHPLVALALSVGLPLWLDGSFGPLAAAAGYGLAVWYCFRNLDGMSGDISGFALTLGELCGCGAAILWR